MSNPRALLALVGFLPYAPSGLVEPTRTLDDEAEKALSLEALCARSHLQSHRPGWIQSPICFKPAERWQQNSCPDSVLSRSFH